MTWLKYVFLAIGVITVGLLIYQFSRPGFKVPTPPGWSDCDEKCNREVPPMFAQKRDDGQCVCIPMQEPADAAAQ